MEKRKLLLVAISAGIFLVIAIGAAIVFTPHPPVAPPRVATIYPAPGGTAINATPPHVQPPAPVQPAPVDPVGMVRAPVDNLGLQRLPDAAARQGGEFVVTAPGQAAPGTVITVPRPTAAAVPAPPARRVEPAPAPRPAPAAEPRPAPVRPAPQPRAHNDYWVQAGSFSTIANAERARDELAFWGITSIIENRVVDGRNWFRVRIGPYSSQDEADHWLALIRSIDGFDSDYDRYRPAVWQTARR